jgi:hypothetical protein
MMTILRKLAKGLIAGEHKFSFVTSESWSIDRIVNWDQVESGAERWQLLDGEHLVCLWKHPHVGDMAASGREEPAEVGGGDVQAAVRCGDRLEEHRGLRADQGRGAVDVVEVGTGVDEHFDVRLVARDREEARVLIPNARSPLLTAA